MRRLFPRMWLLACLWLPFATSQVAYAEPLPSNCDGGTIQSEMGSDTLFYCISGTGGGTGMFAFDSTTTASDNYAYVVTDDQGIILGLPPADMVNFTGAPAGECWVWGLSYTGNLTAQVGDDATSVMLSDACFDLTDNFIVVFRDEVDGGDVSTTDGADTTYVCIDGTDQFVSFASQNAVGPNFAYVVTDAAGNILGLPPGNMVNFAPAGVGECWVWGLSYSGTITASMGDNALTTDLSDGCFDLSDEFLVVFRDEVDGGDVSTTDGADTTYVCIDGTDQFVSFASQNAVGPNFAYVVTDAAGNILGLPPGNMVNFGPAGVGECWVWGLSYSGTITASMGDNALTTDLSDGCFDLSDEFLVVFRDEVDGGDVSTTDGADTTYVCIDGTDQFVSFASQNAVGPNFAYVVTDAAGNILGLPPSNMVNFGPAGVGECWVWGLSYSGTITASMGDNALTTDLSDGCFDLSDEFLVVFRDEVDGGDVSTTDGADTTYVCIDGTDQFVSFASQNAVGPNFAYVVTDAAGNILGLPPGNMVNFGPAGVGECWVWGLSYSGTITASMGDNALTTDLSDGCFDLSDEFLVVFRDEVDGGDVSTTDGADTTYVCIDGSDQFVSFASQNAVGPNFAYVVTDAAGNILGLPPGNMVNFGPAGVGECWVWGLSYSGTITASMGDNALTTDLSDGCFDLSDEFLVVFRDEVDGGDVSTTDGADTTYVCIDGTDQFVSFASQNAVGPNFAYVVTDAAGTILGLPPGNTVNFAPAGVGECWVWGLSYSGDITASMGDNALTTDLTDGCYDLSDNFLVVFRQELGLEIDYKNSENGGSAVTNRTIKPQLRVKNVGEKTLDLNRITMRYWFTEDVAGTYYSMCQGSDAGCAYTSVNIVNFTPAVPGADAYLEVGFTSGTIMPGERVNTRSLIRRNDGQNFDESDDHSFIGPASDHVMNPNVTLYYDGNLIAGTEPAGYSGQRLASQNGEFGKVMEVAIYPNPFMQKLELELDEAPAEGYQVRLTNLQGQVVFSGLRYGQKETLQVDQLPAGMYILQVEAGEARFTERVIKH